MKHVFLLLLTFLPLLATAQQTPQKVRVLVLTDIENEPDDAQSMVRFLTYVNQWDVEGLIATTSVHQRNRVAPERIRRIVEAYGKVRNNLLLHEKGYPETEALLRIIKPSVAKYGMNAVGPGNDSEGSEHIISVVDKADPRPVWVPVWGGANCLAQALWKVRQTRTPDELDRFVAKLRVYTISDQDDSGPWLRKTFPNLFFIVSPGIHDRGAYEYSTWRGISGDVFPFAPGFAGPDSSIVNNAWLDANIRKNHGPLGAEHPHTVYIMEGDTPSFFNLIVNGLSVPERPDWGGWGGRYELYTPRTRKWFSEPETRPIWSDAEDQVKGKDGNYYDSNKATIWRWRQHYQNDFAARIDWTVKPYNEANHPPVAKLGHANEIRVKSGETVTLSADGSSDPDGNALTYEWIYYREAGTFESARLPIIKNKDQKVATLVVPKALVPETMHIILAVTDNGTPALTRYQRVILTVMP
ncbi:MAG: DUF1593 domain-containing protein [Cytophagales bacterium]|nr:MAG: DUF1593 domain-containing protein [Cytophagales bacterium]